MDSFANDSYYWRRYLARMPQFRPEHNWMMSPRDHARVMQQIQDMNDSRANTPRHMMVDAFEEVD